MTQETLREELKRIVDSGDEDLLLHLYEAANEFENEIDLEMTEEDVNELERRWQKVQNGEAILYSWEEVKETITRKDELYTADF